MPTKAEQYAQMADRAEKQLTSNWKEWTSFLTTAARMYKYSYADQLMIYIQRSDATACAAYDLWNKKMGRYVRRGSKGIALLDETSARPRLHYVFDISDTNSLDHSRRIKLWEYRPEHAEAVSTMLERQYNISGESDIEEKLERAAAQIAEEYWLNHKSDILNIVDNSFLYGYDDFNIGAAFRNAATVSTAYALMSRCGMHPENHFEHEDFQSIFDFNTPEAVAELGTAVSTMNQEILRQIEITIKNYEREHYTERTAQHEKRPDLHEERRLSNPGFGVERTADETIREIRYDAQIVSEREPAGALQPSAAEREAVSPLSGDRGDSEPASGRDDAAAGEGSRSHRGTESSGSAEMGGPDEQLQGTGRRNNPAGADLQLRFTLFPSESEQIQSIDEAENVKASSAFSFVQSDIDQFLRYGGNTDRQRECIAAEFSKQKSLEENAAYLRSVFFGGNGIITETGKVTSWYARDGIHLSRSQSARYDKSAQIISWESAAERIGQLLEVGSFATNVELAEAPGYERSRLSERIWHLAHDLREEVQDRFLRSLKAPPDSGFPAKTAWLSQKLTDPVFRARLSEEYTDFLTAYAADRDILRFHYHRPWEIADTLSDLERPRTVYQAEATELPAASFFITEDELDAAISAGSGVAGGKNRIYAFFKEPHPMNEKADFLKKEYGTGGRSHALSGATWSDESHDYSGQCFQKKNCPEVKLTWEKVAKRIDLLIRTDKFLTDAEQEQITALEQAHYPDTIAPTAQAEERELLPGYIAGWYVVEDLQKRGSLDITKYNRLEDALNAYHALPSTRLKALGAENTHQPLQGSLDLLHCINGQDTIVKDWEKTGDWNNPEVLGVIQTLEEHAAQSILESDPLNPVYTPWGPADHTTFLQHGIFQVSTASHGGMMVSREQLGKYFSPRAQEVGFHWGGYHCYEEDCDAPVAIRELLDCNLYPTPDNYDPGEFEEIIDRSIKQYHPEYWLSRSPQEGEKAEMHTEAENYHITDEQIGEGGPKAKFRANMDAINLLKKLEAENRNATPEEQDVLARYVGWGGLADAFDEKKDGWANEYTELYAALSSDEYAAARASTLNAHYTSPVIIHAIYEAVGNMGFETGNILEPSMGIGNFFGMLPDTMRNSRLYGVELDSISGRIAQKLYPHAEITVVGFETTDRRDFYDLAIGNVPFGNYKVSDKPYDKLGFSIHNYFFAKALDQVRPGGVIAFVTSRYTMDQKSPDVRKYLAQRAELLGAIRLPNNAFKANAGAEVVSDILFLQKREYPIDIDPDWVHLGQTSDGLAINSYFLDHPEMVLGKLSTQSTRYGNDITVLPMDGAILSDQLKEAVMRIGGTYQPPELVEVEMPGDVPETIPADPSIKNFSYAVVDGEIYFRENSAMRRADLNETAQGRVKGMIALRKIVRELIDYQLQDWSEEQITAKQRQLETAYDSFTRQYGLINSKANAQAFADDSSYYLLCSLENIDENKQLKSKADIFYKRTIRPLKKVVRVDTPSEALAVSIGERGKVDLPYMSQLLGGKEVSAIVQELHGIIFKDPVANSAPESGWQTADEYLSGNVREKLAIARMAAKNDPAFSINVQALEQAQPQDLDASEIDVRLGATWIAPEYIQQFMVETFATPYYLRRSITVKFAPMTAQWQITGKTNTGRSDVTAYTTYGTDRANAYRILEDTLNLRDIRIYDIVEDADGKQKRVLNKKETTLAQQKQQAIKDAFRDWIWKDPRRREVLVKQYNNLFNATRPREYDGSHIVFGGMNPEIQLREHQKNAIAHVLYGGNTLLAHEVGAGKTFEMVASAMEAKRLGLCQKSLFVVPNHLTDQWASEFLRLYPSANILVTTKKDFEPHNRKRFCSRIATGDYDAVIIGHSQFEKIPISPERQERILRQQIEEIQHAIIELQSSHGENFSIKQMEKTRKSLQTRLDKLNATDRKDDVLTFEQLGVDRLFVDESHAFKNLFLYTKMRNVAGLSTSEAQKSSDMFMKCQYLDELTGGRGVVFATGTPVSNSMTELYTVMRYLQYNTLQKKGLTHFDCWASTFGETTTAIELAPEGTGYRARTRFAKFFNLPELMSMFKEIADVKTADQLHLPVPEATFETVVVQPSEHQQALVQELSQRAGAVHSGSVDPSVDNMLKITSDGRKLGLDQRLINPLLPDDPDSKLNACVRNVLRIWEEGKAEKLTQLLFCDLSTPKADGSFSVYNDIKSKLLSAGVPEKEVAFIHDADTEVKKKELFAKVRAGQVRVLLGSTQKMGAGTNCQDRLIALHHLDVGWRPSDMTQRNGRIIRQGNRNKEVQVYQYVTEGTFDAYLYQTLENKQKFISQIMTSKSPVRSCEDVDEQVLSYAEIKALCAGNPLIKEKMDLDIDVARLRVLKADHQSKQYRLEDQLLKYFPAEIESQHGLIQGFQTDIQTVAQHPQLKDSFVGITIGKARFSEKEAAGEAILAACTTVKNAEPVSLGHYRGFDMELSFDGFTRTFQIALTGSVTHHVTLGTDVRGNITRIDHVLEGISKRLEAAQQLLETLEKQQQAAQIELGKPFAQEAELTEKSKRLAELDIQLNMEEKNADPAQNEQNSMREEIRRLMQAKSGEKKPRTHEPEGR